MLVALAGCDGGDEPQADATSPAPALGPPGIAPDPPDPCLLTEGEIAEVVGTRLPQVGTSGGNILALCTYGGEESGLASLGTVDLAVVDLALVSAESGEDVDGEGYISELVAGVGTGTSTTLEGLGDGSAVVLSYPFGSQAWAWVDGTVYGAYVTDLEDAEELAADLLRSVLDGVEAEDGR
jgi:hypothetical protein